jgi:hypothetical protein
MTNAGLITFATAMFTILNPIGNTAVFAGMVSERSKADQHAIAIRCALAVAVILIVTVWIGEEILKLFGVEVASLEAAVDPLVGEDLYFVADPEGGHTFSTTLESHLRAVARWRNYGRSSR